ncbi:hypothetical protein GCM10023147_25190 [Tsukamurella soli]|uniref:Uncharacterized protein n=2 Tax=Tsukamurella soli TaxID=644556 RepID=A0ABP8JP98_9ACTN
MVVRLGNPGEARAYLRDEAFDPGLPRTQLPGIAAGSGECVQSDADYQCGVTSGRYVTLSVNSSRADAEQEASAAYLILRRAG